MAAPPADSGALDPDSVGRHDFTTTFRGFDQVEVRAYLNKVGAELRSAVARAEDLAGRLTDVEARLSAAEEPDEHRLTSMLGEETARILDAAREAATEIRTKAETKTAELVREAQDEANRMTSEAAEVLRTRTTEAEEAAAAMRSAAEETAARVTAEANENAERTVADAEQRAQAVETSAVIEAETLTTTASAEAERIVERATEEAEQAVAAANETAEELTTSATAVKEAADAEATDVLETARQQGREMVAEAQVVRERILTDLARRRKAARAQLEQLRAGRDRLVEAYAVVRRTLEEATTELSVAVPEARVAAEVAGRRVEADDDDLSVEDIEAELDAGRFAGLPLLDTAGTADEDDDDEIDVVDVVDEVDVEVLEIEVLEVELVEGADGEEHVAEVTDLFARIRAEVPTTDGDAVEDADPADGDPLEEADNADSDPTDDAADAADAAEGDGVVDEDRLETVLEARDRRTVPLEKSLTRTLKRRLADDENDKLDLIRRMSAKDGAEEVLGALDAHRAPIVASVRAVAADAGAAGADFAAELLAGSGDASVSGDVVPDIDDLVDDLVDSVLTPIREKLKELLAGSHDDEALDGVRACYRQWKARAGELAAQLVHAAFNRGVYAAVPDGTPVTWVLDDGDGPCPDGADDALAGTVAKGEEFPTGHLHPPAHPACRCLLVPGGL